MPHVVVKLWPHGSVASACSRVCSKDILGLALEVGFVTISGWQLPPGG